jgi:hypothetical protein
MPRAPNWLLAASLNLVGEDNLIMLRSSCFLLGRDDKQAHPDKLSESWKTA